MPAAVAQPVRAMRDDYVMDTRTPSPVQKSEDGSEEKNGAPSSAEEGYQPDLSKEVAMLSTKLINAINYQTNLDDSLQATRHDLEQAQQELARVRAEKQSRDEEFAQGIWIKKSEVEKTMTSLRRDLIKERMSRESAEKAKKQTDGELENLTSSLFEEANQMVAEARKETEAVEKKSAQLRTQLNDTELLLASQTEQLQDLKLTMSRLERPEANARDSSLPSTPITAGTATFDALQASPTAADMPDILPDHPLAFSQLLAPALRNDTSAYNDFAELLASARKGAPHSRNASGNMSSQSQTNLASMTSATGTSSPQLPGAFNFSSSSASNSPSTSTFASTSTAPPLKDSKFYKRVLIEDIEPTLRLDQAPGLSFLSRRTVTSSLLNGTLVVEPFNQGTPKFYSPVFPCALCGESRKAELYVRKHRFRTSESEDAQRYPLCDYCLSRTRAAGDFLGFLRMVRDGHWRCASEEDEKSAWEEAVKLRERMFWARVGGGVVPAAVARMQGAQGPESPSKVDGATATSLERVHEQRQRRSVVPANAVVTPENEIPPAQEQEVPQTPIDEAKSQQTPEQVFKTRLRARSGSDDIRQVINNLSSQQEPQTELPQTESQQPSTQAKLSREASFEDAHAEFSTPPPEPETAEPQADLDSTPMPATRPESVSRPTSKSRASSTASTRSLSPTKRLALGHERRASSPRAASAASPRSVSPTKRPGGAEERRGSSVLERVRAMEAGGGK